MSRCSMAHLLASPTAVFCGILLNDKRFKAKRRLCLTATPRFWSRLVVNATDRTLNDFPNSMDNETLFGPVVYRLDYSDSVKRNITVPIRMVVINASRSYVEAAGGLKQNLTVNFTRSYERTAGALKQSLTLPWAKDIPVRHVELMLALEEAFERLGIRFAIMFHSRIKYSRQFVRNAHLLQKALGQRFRLRHSYVDSLMSDIERRRVLEEAKTKPSVVSNCFILSTGVDIPAVDAVVFANRKQSVVSILQSVARAARKAPSKQIGYVIVPVYSAHSERNAREDEELERESDDANEEKAMAADDASLNDTRLGFAMERKKHFSAIMDVMQAWATQDNHFAESVGRYAERIGLGSLAEDDEYLEEEKAIQERFVAAPSVSLDFVRKSVSFAVVELARWDYYCGLVEAFRRIHGHCKIPPSYVSEDGFALGQWSRSVRTAFKRKALATEKIDQLDKIDFVWDLRKKEWTEAFDHLLEYKAVHGDCLTVDGMKLGQWVVAQRAARDKGRLPLDEEKLLNKHGFVWSTSEANDLYMWRRGFLGVLDFHTRKGHCRVPRNFSLPTGFKLGQWVTKMRAWRRTSDPRLPAHRVAELDAIDFFWTTNATSSRIPHSWDDMLDKLTAFKAEHGHLRINPSNSSWSAMLYRWLWWRKRSLEKGGLPPDKAERLKQVLGSTDPKPKEWNEVFEELKRWKEAHGHCNVPVDHDNPDQKYLSKWISRQRERKRKGILLLERFEKLDRLGVVWDHKVVSWHNGYTAFKEFRRKHVRVGGLLPTIPADVRTADGICLRRWCQTQRARFKKGRLPVTSFKLLNEAGFDWTPPIGRTKKFDLNVDGDNATRTVDLHQPMEI